MKQFLSKINRLPANQLIALLSLAGMLIAMQINYIQHGWVNNDSPLYFEAARLFAAGEWRQGFLLFEWPLYSGLIALTHKLTGYEIHLSAQILNVLFFGIATAAFLKLIQLAGGDQNTLLAGGLVLFSSQYVVGDILQMLLRDQGFWAFFLLSLVFFIRFYRHRRLPDAIFWQLAAIIANLFRIEGFSYLLALPLILLWQRDIAIAMRLQMLLKAHCINIIIAIGIFLLVFSGHGSGNLGRLNEIFTPYLYQQLTANLMLKSEIMATQVLGNYLDDFAVQGLLLTFVFVVLSKIVSASGPVCIGLAAYALKSSQRLISPDGRAVIIAVMLIAIVNMFLIITKVFVLSGRYTIPMALMVMLLAVFGLRGLWAHSANGWKSAGFRKWLLPALLIIMALGLVKNLVPKRDGYNYQQDGVAWLQADNVEQRPVLFDNDRVAYYANAPYPGLGDSYFRRFESALGDGSIANYDYVVVSLDREELGQPNRIDQLGGFKEVHRSWNTRGNKAIVIYRKVQ
ncbi:MAG: hypothetical protein RL194_317 [Pseudomonadota bacterium]